jgi:hypothetical protein
MNFEKRKERRKHGKNNRTKRVLKEQIKPKRTSKTITRIG